MNAPLGWIQLALYLGVLLLITKPLGLYLIEVLDARGRTWLDPLWKPVERITYRLCGVDPEKEQHWRHYTISMLFFSLFTMLVTYVILRLQAFLPLQHLLNPQGFPALSDHLSFNTAASFTTNTNWQSYGGESTMSYLAQMVALASQNFFSAAVGIAIAAALVRGIARSSAETVGNFWVDLVRIIYYLLLPICVVFAIFLISQGIIQNFKPYDAAALTEKEMVQAPKNDTSGNPIKNAQGNPVMVSQVVDTQTIPQGPMASQIAIKMLGTNGGGYTNANAAYPFENPTPFSECAHLLAGSDG
jgi:K+-transporting ATPase ATPase A chain